MSDKEIVDRLKAEGELVRNRGKNSIKAVLVKMEKFNELFVSIDKNLTEQTAILRSNLNLQTEEIERARRETNFQEVAKPKLVANDSKPAANTMPKGDDKSFFGGLAGLITGGLMGMNTGKFTSILAKSLYGGFIGILAPAIGNWMGDFVEQGLKNMDVSDILASAGGDAIGNAATMGLIGSIFSKRIAVLFAAGGFMSSFADELLDGMGFTEEQLSKDLIAGFTTQDVAGGVMFAIGTALSTVLLKKSLWSSIFSVSSSAASAILSKTGLGILSKVTIPTAVVGAYLMYGDAAKNFLDNYIPEDISSIMVDTASGAAFGGSIAGLPGAIAGGIVSLALSLGKTLFDWLQDTEDNYNKKVKEELDKKSDAQLIEEMKTGKTDFLQDLSASTVAQSRVAGISTDKITAAMPQSNNLSADDIASANDLVVATEQKLFDREQRSRMTKAEIDKAYTDLMTFKSKLDDLQARVDADPNLSSTPEALELRSFKERKIYQDLENSIQMLETELGAKLITQPKTGRLTSGPSLYAPRSNVDEIISVEPANVAAVQTAMEGAAKREAAVNVVQVNAPTTINQGGATNIANNNSVAVATGGASAAYRSGYAY